MIVTISTLNALGLEVPIGETDKIINLVTQYEADYFRLCLSAGLANVFTEATKDTARFTALRESSIVDEVYLLGMDYGVNYYIYFYYLLDKYQDISNSGITVLKPHNSVQLSPNPKLNKLWNKAVEACIGCRYYIEENVDNYAEVTEFEAIETRSNYNF